MIEGLQKTIRKSAHAITKGSMSETEVDDVVQEVNLSLLREGTARSLKSFDPSKSKLSTWIYMITRTVIIDLAKAKGKVARLEVYPSQYPSTHGSKDQSPSGGSRRHAFDCFDISKEPSHLDALVDAEQKHRLHQAIAKLSPSDQKLVHLLFEGTSKDLVQYAADHGVKIQTVYTRKKWIIRKLTALLSESAD